MDRAHECFELLPGQQVLQHPVVSEQGPQFVAPGIEAGRLRTKFVVQEGVNLVLHRPQQGGRHIGPSIEHACGRVQGARRLASAESPTEAIQPDGARGTPARAGQGRQVDRGVQTVVELLRLLAQCSGRDHAPGIPVVPEERPTRGPQLWQRCGEPWRPVSTPSDHLGKVKGQNLFAAVPRHLKVGVVGMVLVPAGPGHAMRHAAMIRRVDMGPRASQHGTAWSRSGRPNAVDCIRSGSCRGKAV